MKRIYDRFATSTNKDNGSEQLLLFHHNQLVATFDLKPSIEELLYVKGWTKEKA